MADANPKITQPAGQAGEVHASTAHTAPEDHIPTLFSFEPGIAIWALTVFILLLIILRKFAWGPIISSIEEREKNIRDSLDKARQAQNESKRIANEQNEILNQAKSEASIMIQEAKHAAETLSNNIKQDAQEEKSKIVESGIREIEAAKAAAITSLKKETASLAIEIAEKLIQDKMDDVSNRAYVDKLIDELSISEK